ncbi:hypothetical protein F5I97DRAFT_1926851 [Phlebopus sp. FC_14]|nr:hypothetical protein F5I97DRAFT_1926851 [Phlebopus sp. FC_14]
MAARFEQQGDSRDFEEALQLRHIAEAETPSHPMRFFICQTFSDSYFALWRRTHMETRARSTMSYHKAAADINTAGSLRHLSLCLGLAGCGERQGHGSTLDAYERGITLLDIHLSASASVSAHHGRMKCFPTSLAVDAASCALRRDNILRALELLEQARALLRNQMTRFRTSLDDLRSRDAHREMLVKRFQELGFQLSRQSDEPPSGSISRATLDDEARHYRHLVNELNEVVAKIRGLDGYSRFLLPPLFSDLQEAACDGPVIVLVAVLANQLRKKPLYSSVPDQRSIVDVLRQLWDTVMLPGISKLEELLKRGSRVWRTSVFTSFPLDAVGEYKTPRDRTCSSRHTSSPAHFAAIGQALPGEIEGLLPASCAVFTKLTGSASTREEAYCAFMQQPLDPFPCHSRQKYEEPFKSCLKWPSLAP